MKLIVNLDERNGMSFNNRRQSRDRAVTRRIASLCNGCDLWIHPVSVPLFSDFDVSIRVSEDYLHCAQDEDWCFAEIGDMRPDLSVCEQVVIFRWNRTYPYDCKFPMELLQNEFTLSEMVEFEGYSHAIITMEVYSR